MNDKDALLKDLAALVREEAAEDFSPSEVPPFDERAVDQMTARILGETPAKARVVRPWRGPRVMTIGAPLAAAAGLVLWLATRAPREELPAFELTIVSAKTERAHPNEPKAEVALDPQGEVSLLARPTTSAPHVAVRAVLIDAAGARAWRVPLEVSPDGSVLLRGPTSKLFPQTNAPCEIMLVVAPTDALPSEEDAIEIAGGRKRADSSLRVLRTRVRFVQSP